MVNFVVKEKYDLNDMIEIVHLLRTPEGCPWDREQTHESIRRNFIEEVCEAVEAIDQKDTIHLREELGDVLMQVLFHADIENDAGRFDINDVADAACKKLVERHPHVFAQAKADTSELVLENWDEIKRRQNGHCTTFQAMDSVSRTLPALWRGDKILGKAEKAGFRWNDVYEAMFKLSEEVRELQQAIDEDMDTKQEELGDLLLAAVSVARYMDVDPEVALNAACDKYMARFKKLEQLAESQSVDMEKCSTEELVRLWEEAKKTDQ